MDKQLPMSKHYLLMRLLEFAKTPAYEMHYLIVELTYGEKEQSIY